MRMKKPSGLRHAAILVSLLLPATAFADPLPGTVDPDNGTDPLFDLYEGKTTELTVTTTILGHKVALPFDVENGDVVLCEAGSGACSASDTSNWSDVVRFSGVSLAPGYGNVVNIYSVDDGTLPSASSLSSNAVFLFEDPSGVTFYDPQNLLSTGGDLIQGLQTSAAAYYNIHSPEEPSTGVPEPSIPVLLIGALGAIGLGVRRRPPTTV